MSKYSTILFFSKVSHGVRDNVIASLPAIPSRRALIEKMLQKNLEQQERGEPHDILVKRGRVSDNEF